MYFFIFSSNAHAQESNEGSSSSFGKLVILQI